jgi:hypothetical protein
MSPNTQLKSYLHDLRQPSPYGSIGWKTTLLTSVFLSLTSVKNSLAASHGTTLTDFADVDADVDEC